jgi:hypothetical protein
MIARGLIIAVVTALPFWLSAQEAGGQLCGMVVDEGGAGVKDALVIASGSGFQGWATTAADGSFCVPHAGAFISARHAGFNPIVKRISALGNQNRIQLARADRTVKTLPRCQSLPANGRGWIGGGLRIKPPSGHYRGPAYGEHDSHWYVSIGRSTLNIVDGYAWHAGLPLESLLSASKSIEVRGWEFGNTVGLDLSGQLENGRRWRWFGAPIAEAIGYENTPPREAELFDRVLETVCFDGQ